MTKTQIKKQIAKLTKVPHPKGRKTAQLAKKVTKSAAREKVKLSHQMRTNLTGERLLWFQEHLAEGVAVYTPDMVIEIIERYLRRFDEEFEQIQLKHGVGKRGRQHASREDAIRMTKEREAMEFNTCGIEMPNLLNTKQFNLLRTWKGELRFLQNFKLTRYSRNKLEGLKEKEGKKTGGKTGEGSKTDDAIDEGIEEGEEEEDRGEEMEGIDELEGEEDTEDGEERNIARLGNKQ